jgi:hypothetical protein
LVVPPKAFSAIARSDWPAPQSTKISFAKAAAGASKTTMDNH